MTRIKDLNSLPSIGDNDLIPVFSVEQDATRKATLSQIVDTASGLAAPQVAASVAATIAAPNGSNGVGYQPVDGQARTVQDKLRERVSVFDYMTPEEIADAQSGAPVMNHRDSIQRGVTARAGKHLLFPVATYNIIGSVGGDGTQIIELEQGATITGGGGIFNVSRLYFTNGILRHVRKGGLGTLQTAGQLFEVENTGGAGYALRLNLKQSGAVASGFAIGMGSVCEFPGVNGGQGLASWLVAATPIGTTNTFGVFGQEVNPINRAGDSGYARRRGALPRWTGGIQIVPEAKDLVGGTGNNCFNVTYAFAVACSGDNKADGTPAKSYNGLLIEQNGIAPGGRGVLASGDTTAVAADLPHAGVEVDQRWRYAIKTTDGIFDQGRAGLFGNNQWLAWENASRSIGFKVLGVTTNDDVLMGAAKAGGRILFAGNAGAGASPVGAPSFSVLADAAATSYLQAESGAGTGSNAIASLSAKSDTETNVHVRLTPKGTGVPMLDGLRNYADDAAAAAGGVPVKGLYHNAGAVRIRLA